MLDSIRSATENADHLADGLRSARFGFRPAFLDFATMQIHPARFADGRPAPCHLLDGLPDEAVVERLPSGRVARAKATLICGYERNGFFYTRSSAERACREWREARTPPAA
jgi:hypothetical protein